MPECQKCKNAVLPERKHIEGGITAQPCPICGDQNYGFLECHQQRKDGAEVYEGKCELCGCQFYYNYHGKRRYCDECLVIVRSDFGRRGRQSQFGVASSELGVEP